jgi:hypothetical protein
MTGLWFANLARYRQADDFNSIGHNFIGSFAMRDKVESHAVIDVKEFSADYVALVYPYTVTSQVLLDYPAPATYFCYNGSCEHRDSPNDKPFATTPASARDAFAAQR